MGKYRMLASTCAVLVIACLDTWTLAQSQVTNVTASTTSPTTTTSSPRSVTTAPPSAGTEPTLFRCAQDDPLNPVFSTTPGSVKQDTLSARDCALACSLVNHAWAGLQGGKYCLCSNKNQTVINALPAGTNCSMPCPMGTATCGNSQGFTSIYATSGPGVKPTINLPIVARLDATEIYVTTISHSVRVARRFVVWELTGLASSGLSYSIQFGDRFPPRPMNPNVTTQIFPQPAGDRILSVAGVWKGPGAVTPPLRKQPMTINREVAVIAPIIQNVSCDPATPATRAGMNRMCKMSVYLPATEALNVSVSLVQSNFPIGPWTSWLNRSILSSDTGFTQSSTTQIYGPITAPGRRDRIHGGWTGVDIRPADDYLYAVETSFILAASRFPQQNYVVFEILLEKVSNVVENINVQFFDRHCTAGTALAPETLWCLPTTVNATSQTCAASEALNANSGYCPSLGGKSVQNATVGALVQAGIVLAASDVGRMVKTVTFGTGPFPIETVGVSLSSPNSTGVRFAYRKPRPNEESDYAASGEPKVFVARALAAERYQDINVAIPCNPAGYSGVTASFSVTSGSAGNVTKNETYAMSSSWDCQTPISGVRVALNTTAAAVGEMIQYNITIASGAPAAFRVMNAVPGQNTTLWIPDASRTAMGKFSYNTSLDYTYIQAEAYNLLSNSTAPPLLSPFEVTNGFVVQWPVKIGAWTLSIPTISQGIYLETDNVTWTLAYVGTAGQQASNATASINFGDGTPLATVNITNGALSTPMPSHKYKGGVYNASVTVYNLVSNVTFFGTMGNRPVLLNVRSAIANVSADFMYQMSPNDPLVFGAGPNFNQFPAGFNISMFPTVDAGYVEYYRVYTNGTLIKQTNATIPANGTANPVVLSLPEGEYNFTVEACNSKEGCVPSKDLISMTIAGKLYGLTIDDYRLITPPMQQKNFTLKFESLGGSPCVLIDWGDAINGGKAMEAIGVASTCKISANDGYAFFNPNVTLKNPMNISHVYTAEGLYNLSIVAWNSESNTAAYIMVTSMNISCTAPEASIIEPTTGMSFQRSVQAILDGKYILNCTDKVGARVEWSIAEMNETTMGVVRDVDIKNWTSWNRTQLVIPALSLPYGLYRLQFTVFLDGRPIFKLLPVQTSVFTRFYITKTPLVCMVYDGGVSRILKGSRDFVPIKPGLLSYDPDDPKGESVWPVRYEWWCSREGEDITITKSITNPPNDYNYTRNATDLGGCFGSGPAKLNITSLTYTLDAKTFYKFNTTYTITVRMLKDDRYSDSSLDIQILPGTSSPLEVAVACIPDTSCLPPSVSGILINLDGGRFLARGLCQKGCDEFSLLTYQWKVTYDKGALGLEVVPANDSKKFPYGTGNQDLVLDAPFFTTLYNVSPSWKFRLRLTITDLQNGVYGFSEFYMTVNKPPTGGTCQCTASSYPFISIKTILDCACNNWKDPESMGIKSYQFIARRLDITDRVEQVVLPPSAQPQVDFIPVPGSYNITCTIIDIGGAQVVVPVNISFNATDPLTLIPAPATSTSFQMVAPTAQELQDMQKAGVVDTLVKANPALNDMISAVNISIMTSSVGSLLLSVDELQGTSSSSSTGSSGTSATSAAAALAVDKALSTMSAALTSSATALTQTNLATPAQMSSAASTITSLVTAVPLGTGTGSSSSKAAAAISSDFLDAAGLIFQSIGDSLDSNPSSLTKSTITSLTVSAVRTANVIGPALGPQVSAACDDKPPNPDMSTCPSAERATVKLDAAPFPPPIGYVMPTDPDIEKCCLVLQEKAKSLASTTTTIFATTGKLLDALTEKIGENEVLTIPTSPGTTVQVSKTNSLMLPGKQIDVSGTTVKLPANFKIPALSAPGSIGIKAIKMEQNPLQGEGVDSELNTREMSVLMFDLSDATGKTIEIKNLPEPIGISMSRKFTPQMAQQIKDAVNCINATSAGGKGGVDGIIYSSINASAQATFVTVHIRMKDFSAAPEGMHLMIGRGLKPSLIKGLYDPNLLVQVKKLEIDDDGYYAYLGLFNDTFDGPMHVGVFELKTGLNVSSVVSRSNWDNLPSFFKANFTKDYCIRVTDGSVNYFDTKKQMWIADPTLRASAVGKDDISFNTTHLSTFGSGMFVKPNAIDFSSVFANAGFTDNITIYMTLIVTFVIYIMILVYARIKDKQDVEMIGALPLPDNKEEAKYIYEILTVTGDQNSASTHSQIYFIVSGEKDDTGIRTFGKPTKSPRPFFKRGGTDAFVLAVDGPLGDLTYLRLWNDCSGSATMLSWYCSSISIRDVQTGKRYDFVVNSWFSPSDDDCQVDRLIGIASEEDRKQFKYLFETQKTRNLRDGHLWFSVFTRPPRSRYTRAQRVSTCMALLYLSMLANAMWYGTVPDQPGTGALKFGPFALSQEQIGVGMMANLVVLPPSLLIIFLFRKARPRKLRKSRIDEAMKNQRDVLEAKGKGTLPKTRRFTLPWWCTIVAWILCAACIVISIFFLWAYGVTFGNDKCTKWISSLLISFFSSILIIQPLKVLLLAILCSAICKIEVEDDDADEDEEDPTLQWDESYLVEDGQTKKKKIPYGAVGVDSAAVRALRERRLKEKEMWDAIKRIIFYTVYIWIMMVISYNNRDPNASLLRKNMVNVLINPPRLNVSDRFPQVDNLNGYWNWVYQVLVPGLRAQKWYNNKEAIGLQGFMADYNNRMMGYAIMRQIRVQGDSCVVPKKMREQNFTSCAYLSELEKEDRADYCTQWRGRSSSVPDADCDWSEFKYSSASEFDSLPHLGRLDTYTGGGYTFIFSGREREIVSRLQALERNTWLDSRTRAVIVEFAAYNAHVNLFTVAKIVVEAVPGGGLVPAWRFDGIRLMRYFEGFGLVAFIAEVAFVVFTLYFSVIGFRAMCTDRKKYFSSYWSYVEMMQLTVSYIAVALYAVRSYMTDKVVDKFAATMGNAYIAMQPVASVDTFFGYVIAILVFAAALSLLKVMKFNKSIGALSATMKICFDELRGFGFVFAVFLAAFVVMFHLFLYQHLFEWRSITSSFETSFQIMLGKFEFGEIVDTNMFAGVFFFFFNVAMSIIMINFLMTIIISAFEIAKLDMDKNLKDFEIMEFMLARMRTFMGLSNRSGQRPASVRPVAYDPTKFQQGVCRGSGANAANMKEFPQKVDKMLEQINAIYFDGGLDLNNKTWLKSMLKKKDTTEDDDD